MITCIVVLSTIMLSNVMSGYPEATSLQHCRNKPSPSFLWNKKKPIECSPCRTKGSLIKKHSTQRCSHDVSLMHSSDSAATLLPGKSESIVGDPEGIVPGDDLQTLHYPGYTLKTHQPRE